MQAIILAAGMGRRLKELTQNNTKCMVQVNGITLIERLLLQLNRVSVSKIVIVVGYEGEKLINFIETNIKYKVSIPIVYVTNNIYDKTNNIYSLALAKDYLMQDDTLLFESDLIFEDSVIDALLDDPRETLALVDKYESWMDGTCVQLDDEDNITAFVPGKHFNFLDSANYFKTVNIYKFSKEFSCSYYVPFLDAYCSALGNNEYYEQVLRVIAMLDDPVIKGKRLSGQLWYEIDDIQDLDIASSLFAENDQKLDLMQQRFGGYWRYPKLVDYCYLVNPYYPPKKLVDEIKASFETLITQYPSGMQVNSLLAGKNFGVRQENIIVGNGAAELINSLMSQITGQIGIVRPTFEEYPNRYDASTTTVFVPEKNDFSYTADDLIAFFSDKSIEWLIVINPDNPTGNYIPKADLLSLIKWAAEKHIRLIIDESFVDFSREIDSTLINQAIIDANPHLFVMKSISKSYGVPGLRLGVLVSGDVACISKMKKDVSIWNINSFAEFYMQIEEKYKKDYVAARVKFCQERDRFIQNLSQISGIRIFPTEANYIMMEICNGFSSRALTRQLLCEHNLFIKDLSGKIKRDGRQFIRVAVRNTMDNDNFVSALCKCLNPHN